MAALHRLQLGFASIEEEMNMSEGERECGEKLTIALDLLAPEATWVSKMDEQAASASYSLASRTSVEGTSVHWPNVFVLCSHFVELSVTAGQLRLGN